MKSFGQCLAEVRNLPLPDGLEDVGCYDVLPVLLLRHDMSKQQLQEYFEAGIEFVWVSDGFRN